LSIIEAKSTTICCCCFSYLGYANNARVSVGYNQDFNLLIVATIVDTWLRLQDNDTFSVVNILWAKSIDILIAESLLNR